MNIATKFISLSKLTFVFAVVVLGLIAPPASAENSRVPKPVMIGEEISLFSEILSEERKLLIHLPDSYHSNPNKKYPVLYTLDGSTHFYHVTGTMNWLSNQTGRIPEMIVVAIKNTNRGRDLTAEHNGGGANKFLGFIKNELLPYIDENYRTQEFRILSGHSMAGYFTLNVLQQSPELFSAYFTISPWFRQERGEQVLIKQLEVMLSKAKFKSKFVFASIGNEPSLQPMFDQLIATLQQSALSSLDWRSQSYPGDNHMSVVSNTLNDALQALYDDRRLKLNSPVAQKGVEAVKDHFQTISKIKYKQEISPEGAINSLGYEALAIKDFKTAQSFFESNLKSYPQSPNAYDSMADFFSANDQIAKAITMVKKAVEISEKQKVGNLRWYKRHLQRLRDQQKQLKIES